jgi:hypothetical protein
MIIKGSVENYGKIKIYLRVIILNVFFLSLYFLAGLPGAAQMSSYYNSAYGNSGFGSAMHNSMSAGSLAAVAAAAATSPTAHQVVSSMQDAMKAYSSGMDDKYRYSAAALGSMYPSAEAVAAAAAKYMQEAAAGKSYLDSSNQRYFDTSSPNKHFGSGK